MLHHLVRRAFGHHLAAGFAAFRAEVDQPIRRAHHVQVVLDDDQRVPRVQQLAEGAHQLGDVVEVQAGGRFVEQEQRALARGRLSAGRRALGGVGQKAGQLQALRFAAAERRYGLAQLDVIEPHVDDGLQRADHLAVLGEQVGGFGDGQVEDVGDVQESLAVDRQMGVRVQFPIDGLSQSISSVLEIGIRPQFTYGSLEGDFENFRPIALAVAVGAAQVDVGQELHLDVLEARAAAGWAAAVARVEAELGRRVAALFGQRRLREQRADRVPRANVAGRVGARRLADGRLVDKHHVAQMIGAQQALVCAGRFGRLAEVAQQRGRQHVLHQRRFARAADARDDHQPLQREIHRDLLQVVLGRAFQDQARRVVCNRPRVAQTDVAPPAQVGAGQRVGGAQFVRRAIEHDAPAGRAGAGAEVEHAVGRQHDGRVVLDHHQRVAGGFQPLHGFGDAVHVARVQADAGLVEHEQRVDERRAERGGQVDALHLAAGERAALTIEREVADADVAQVLDAGGDFFQDQCQRLGVRRIGIKNAASA